MIKKIFLILFLIGLIIGCSKNEDIKNNNIEQIHRTEGIPVKIKIMEKQPFVKDLIYTATLTGKKQSGAIANIGGRIEKIYVKIGEYVNKDDIIIEFPKDSPSAQYNQAKYAYELAKQTYDRMKNLYKMGGISKHKLEQIKTQYEIDKANWDAVQQLIKVRAPIDGIITNINVCETDDVSKESVLATISNMDKLKAEIWATEDEIQKIKTDMPATVEWQGKKLSGKVTQVAISMARMRQGFKVDLVFDDPEHIYHPGILGKIDIQVYKNPKALILERKTIREDDEGKYVFVVDESIAKKRYVEIGEEDGELEIKKGLSVEDKVIVEGLNLVTDGVKVKIVSK